MPRKAQKDAMDLCFCTECIIVNITGVLMSVSEKEDHKRRDTLKKFGSSVLEQQGGSSTSNAQTNVSHTLSPSGMETNDARSNTSLCSPGTANTSVAVDAADSISSALQQLSISDPLVEEQVARRIAERTEKVAGTRRPHRAFSNKSISILSAIREEVSSVEDRLNTCAEDSWSLESLVNIEIRINTLEIAASKNNRGDVVVALRQELDKRFESIHERCGTLRGGLSSIKETNPVVFCSGMFDFFKISIESHTESNAR